MKKKQHWIANKLTFDEASCVMLSYPRSGRNWVMSMLNRLGAPVHATNEGGAIHRSKTWRVQNREKSIERYLSKRVILLVRDPRDVVVSDWYHHKFRFEGKIRRRMLPLEKHIRSSLGLPFIVGWMNFYARLGRAALVVRYEQLVEDTRRELVRILKFVFGVQEALDDEIDQAIEASSLENMRRADAEGRLPGMADPPEGFDPTGPSAFCRSGRPGGHLGELSPETIEWCNEFIDRHLSDFFWFYRSHNAQKRGDSWRRSRNPSDG